MAGAPFSKLSSEKLGIVAGGGSLPLMLVDACQTANRPFHIIGIDGYAAEKDLKQLGHDWTALGALGNTMEILKVNHCQQVVMAGKVSRPDFKKLKLDWRGAKLLPKFLSAARRGDDALLSVLVDAFEADGFKVVGADDILEDLLILDGPLGAVKPNEDNFHDIERAIEVIEHLGVLDIGQGAVVCNQLVLAVEAVEGTDTMLERCCDISAELRGSAEDRRGVLVKMPKPGQDRRVDLPAIGVETVIRASKAGLAGIAVSAGGALVLDRESLIEKADQYGLFVIGFKQ